MLLLIFILALITTIYVLAGPLCTIFVIVITIVTFVIYGVGWLVYWAITSGQFL